MRDSYEEWEEDDYGDVIKRDHKAGVWITREGDPIHVLDMEDDHLQAAWRFLEIWKRSEKRKHKKRDLNRWIHVFKKNLKKRGYRVD